MKHGSQATSRTGEVERNDYYCVPVVPRRDGQQQPLDWLKRNLLTGRLETTLVTEQDLLIGSGEVEIEGHGQVLRFARVYSAGKLVLPGSSLKGAVRAYAEALSPSCIPVGARQCGDCPACTIFGSTRHQGRFGFEDARFEAKTQSKKIVQRWEPTRECDGRKFYYFDLPNLTLVDKETVETVPANTSIACRARFTNLDRWELGLILLAMGLGDGDLGFSLKIGGAKNRKIGKVRFDRNSTKITLDADLESRVLAKKEQGVVDVDECVKAYLDRLGNVKNQVTNNMERLKKGAP